MSTHPEILDRPEEVRRLLLPHHLVDRRPVQLEPGRYLDLQLDLRERQLVLLQTETRVDSKEHLFILFLLKVGLQLQQLFSIGMITAVGHSR